MDEHVKKSWQSQLQEVPDQLPPSKPPAGSYAVLSADMQKTRGVTHGRLPFADSVAHSGSDELEEASLNMDERGVWETWFGAQACSGMVRQISKPR